MTPSIWPTLADPGIRTEHLYLDTDDGLWLYKPDDDHVELLGQIKEVKDKVPEGLQPAYRFLLQQRKEGFPPISRGDLWRERHLRQKSLR